MWPTHGSSHQPVSNPTSKTSRHIPQCLKREDRPNLVSKGILSMKQRSPHRHANPRPPLCCETVHLWETFYHYSSRVPCSAKLLIGTSQKLWFVCHRYHWPKNRALSRGLLRSAAYNQPLAVSTSSRIAHDNFRYRRIFMRLVWGYIRSSIDMPRNFFLFLNFDHVELWRKH